MSAKQRILKCSLMIKNKYGCQIHSIDTSYCCAQSPFCVIINSVYLQVCIYILLLMYRCYIDIYVSVFVIGYYMCSI